MKVLVLLTVVCWAAGEAPYDASGWKPTGGLLVLPARQQEQRAAPAQQYGPPAQQYGAPAESQKNEQSELERLKQKEGSDSGVYHVLLPDGRLQKIEYATAPLTDIETKPQPQQQEEPAKVWPINFAQNFQQQNSYYRGEQERTAANFQSQQFSRQQEEPAKVWPVNFAQNNQQQKNDYRGEQSAANYQNQQFAPVNFNAQNTQQQGQQVAANYEQPQSSRQEALPSPGFPVRYVEIQPKQAAAQKQQEQETGRNFGASDARPQYLAPNREEPAKVEPQRVMMVMPQPMTYVASIQYRDVEPINPPVYSYNNGASPLVRIIRK